MSAVASIADAPRRLGHLPLLAVTGVLLLGALAVVAPAAALGIPLAMGFVLIAFHSLAAGLALFTLLISLEYIPGLEGDIGFIKVAGGVLVAAWAARLLRQRRETPLLLRDRPWVSAILIGIVLWAFASALWAADSSVAISSALRLSQGILLVFVVYSALRKPLHLRWLFSAYVVGALITVGVGMLSNTPVDESGRLAGAVGDPNELAAFLLPAVMLCAFAILAGHGPLARLAYFTTGLILLVAVFMTGSRGGLLALAAALAAAIAMAGRERVKIVSAVLVIAGCGVAYFTSFAPSEQVDRLAALRDDGGTGRSDIWAVAFETARDRPVLGVGAGNFPVVEGRYATQEVDIGRIDLILDEGKVVHNTYLSFLSELGVVGFLAFAFLAVAALSSGALAVRRLLPERWELQLVTRGFLIGLLGMLVAFAFFSAQYEKQLWLLLGAAFALPSCLPRRSEAPEPTPVLGEPTDYYRRMSELDPESPLGELSGRDEVVGTARHRLARREASLIAREQLVARREHELRHGTVNGAAADDSQTEAAAEAQVRFAAAERRLAELEAELARTSTALTESTKKLEETRNLLDESLRLRVADAERLAEAATFVLETERRAEDLHEKAELQKSKLRAKVRELQRRLEESEEGGAASLAEKVEERTLELDARERDLADREQRLRRREKKPPADEAT